MSVPKLQERDPQPAMVVRAEVRLDEIGPALHRILPLVGGRIREAGGMPAGAPFTRYLGFADGGLLKIEVGMPTLDVLPSAAEVESVMLDGGTCITLMHAGPYELLPAAHLALDEWFETSGYTPAGHRWEAYLTDPGTEPDPSKWHTLITQPLATA